MAHFQGLIGKAPEFQNVVNAARLVAMTDVTVLVLGESGTGKEVLARTIHESSRRNARPFVSVNCAALPDTLAEAELFGYRKGAFTGAETAYEGRVRAAEGGTLFLDEIGDLPLALQTKLLRFLESGECQVIGEQVPRNVNVRVIAATNRDLREAVRAGRFREDLYYRLYVVPLELPPLRARNFDIQLFIDHFCHTLAQRYGLNVPYFSPEALEHLYAYRWPGNVRELRNFCERMVVLMPGATIRPENLPQELRTPVSARHEGGFVMPDGGVVLDALERDLIHQALSRTGGNRSRAARMLGLTRDTLQYRIKKHAIES